MTHSPEWICSRQLTPTTRDISRSPTATLFTGKLSVPRRAFPSCISTADRGQAAPRVRAGTSTRTCFALCCSISAAADAARPRADDPSTDLSTNTTDHLITDIERLREHLGIDKWVVAGVSWGVCLALAYAQAHPDRVTAMALGAITTGSRREVEWITRDMRRLFPREWERFVEPVPPAERDTNLAAAYTRLLAHPDAAVRENAALRWCEWEDTHVSLVPGWAPSPRYQDPTFRMMFARVVTHYWGNDHFLDENQLLDGMHRLTGIPAVLVHGRYDISGPLDTAWELSRRWDNSRLVVVEDAGHGGGSFTGELVEAISSVAETTRR